jgi:NifU-like protein involved in Fe-S cluster formation
MLTELALGKTVAEAGRLSNSSIEAAFEGTLELQGNCPLAGITALQMAIEDYKKKHGA